MPETTGTRTGSTSSSARVGDVGTGGKSCVSGSRSCVGSSSIAGNSDGIAESAESLLESRVFSLGDSPGLSLGAGVRPVLSTIPLLHAGVRVSEQGQSTRAACRAVRNDIHAVVPFHNMAYMACAEAAGAG